MSFKQLSRCCIFPFNGLQNVDRGPVFSNWRLVQTYVLNVVFLSGEILKGEASNWQFKISSAILELENCSVFQV